MAPTWEQPHLVIGGTSAPADGQRTYDNVDPSTGDVIGQAADGDERDVERAIASARAAFDDTDWSTDVERRVVGLRQLHDALVTHTDALIETTIREVGAPRMACDTVQVREPLGFVPYYADMAEQFEWHTALGRRNTLGGPAERWIEREAAGVVAAITPWNVPTQINLAKIAPALAAGCTVVLKPAVETPWTGVALADLVANHTDIPPGVLNVVTGADPALGAALTSDARIDVISFTGSTATGRKVMAAASENITRVFLELGGKSAHIVLDDVDDMGGAAAMAAFALATVAGQGCALATRVLLPRSRYDEGVEALASMLAMVPVGDPADPATMMGPLISARQHARVSAYVDGAVTDGARLVCGGGRPAGLEHGNFYAPTLLAGVTNDMTAAREEIFGPVLVAIAFDDDDDAVRIANDSPFGLSGAVFGSDDRALGVARRIRTGTMSVNGGVWYSPDVPFGGYKHSGIGREMGAAGFEEYLETKAYARPAT